MTVVRPIFIVGVGRSGSTLLHQILARHPHVVWLSGVTARWPDRPGRNRAYMQLLDLPVFAPLLRRLAIPGESYAFWDQHYRGFSEPFRDLHADDVTHETHRSLRASLACMTTWRRQRHLLKITGWPRLGFLHAIFPDARFIHLIRDGRAVAHSLLSVPFWRGWQGPAQWRWGPLSAEQYGQWEAYDRSFVVLAALQWKILIDAMECARTTVPAESFLQVRYETLCDAPHQTLEEIVTFAGLPWSALLDQALIHNRLYSRNEKWRQELTAVQQSALSDVLADTLTRYGYRP